VHQRQGDHIRIWVVVAGWNAGVIEPVDEVPAVGDLVDVAIVKPEAFKAHFYDVYGLGAECLHKQHGGLGHRSAPLDRAFRDKYPTPKPKAPKKGSKLSHAVFILRQNPELSRVKLIAMIKIACDMSTAGATTYYYNAKKAS